MICHKRFELGILTLHHFDAATGGYRLSWRESMLMAEEVSLERIRIRKRYDIPLKNDTKTVAVLLGKVAVLRIIYAMKKKFAEADISQNWRLVWRRYALGGTICKM